MELLGSSSPGSAWRTKILLDAREADCHHAARPRIWSPAPSTCFKSGMTPRTEGNVISRICGLRAGHFFGLDERTQSGGGMYLPIIRRNSDRNGELALFFARALGRSTLNVGIEANDFRAKFGMDCLSRIWTYTAAR